MTFSYEQMISRLFSRYFVDDLIEMGEDIQMAHTRQSSLASRSSHRRRHQSSERIQDTNNTIRDILPPERREHEEDLVSTSTYIGSTVSITKDKKKRGPTTVEALRPKGNTKWILELNDRGQPVGSNAGKLSKRLGTIVREAGYFPLHLPWKQMPQSTFDDTWTILEEEYEFPPDPRLSQWVSHSLNQKWRDWKSKLKTLYYDPYDTDEARIIAGSSRVDPHQWQNFVNYLNRPEIQTLSATNNEIRGRKRMRHRSGTKSFARIEAEMHKHTGVEHGLVEVFLAGYSGNTNNKKARRHPETEELLTQIRDVHTTQQSQHSSDTSITFLRRPITEVLGEDRPGRVRGMVVGVTKKDVCSPTYIRMGQILTKSTEENVFLKAQNKKLEKKIEKMNSRVSRLMAHMNLQESDNSEEE